MTDSSNEPGSVRDKKYWRELLKIKQNPSRAVVRLKRYEIVGYVVGFLSFFLIFLFYNSFSEFVSLAFACVAGVFITIGRLSGESAKNITPLVEVVDWEKVELLNRQQ